MNSRHQTTLVGLTLYLLTTDISSTYVSTTSQGTPKRLEALARRFQRIEDDDATAIPRASQLTPLSVAPPLAEDVRLKELEDSGMLELVTNFNVREIRDLIQRSLPFWNAHRSRGPSPKLSLGDHWVLLLACLKSAEDLALLAKNLDIKLSTALSSLDRMRGVALDTLKNEWWTDRLRPVILPHPFRFIALLIDSTSIQIQKPVGSFSESKKYFDNKNHIYAIKKEVAVMANAPHYALFSSPGTPGSSHDYRNLKKNFKSYLPYLLKTPEESSQLSEDSGSRSWAALLDNGYQGPATDTPDFRRITLDKHSHIPSEEARRQQLARLRVPVEQFFGRVWKLWKAARGPYKWDHAHFDADIDLCILLTNEHMRNHNLTNIDYEFRQAVLALTEHEQESKIEKRKCSQKRYMKKKKGRIDLANFV